MAPVTSPASETVSALREAVLHHGGKALPGGVSSDIQLVEVDGRQLCIKQALPRLKVQADWRAPVERNHSEAEWMRVAAAIVPGAVPAIVHEDREGGWFAMEYLPPAQFPVWKTLLRDGIIEPAFAAVVGRCLVRIHAATAGSSEIAARFATDHIFYPIRVEPYLVATAGAHPDLESRLLDLAQATMGTHAALVHGDVSPKNILAGAAGPVLLDAECAWYGDPAFDLAFVLNHMLLKCAWRPQWTGRYIDCFTALSVAYEAGVTWEPKTAVVRRVAHLLPGLLLGRVDGKSPVEYITSEREKDMIRGVARRLLLAPVDSLAQLSDAWVGACNGGPVNRHDDKFDMGTPPL